MDNEYVYGFTYRLGLKPLFEFGSGSLRQITLAKKSARRK